MGAGDCSFLDASFRPATGGSRPGKAPPLQGISFVKWCGWKPRWWVRFCSAHGRCRDTEEISRGWPRAYRSLENLSHLILTRLRSCVHPLEWGWIHSPLGDSRCESISSPSSLDTESPETWLCSRFGTSFQDFRYFWSVDPSVHSLAA